VIPNEPSEVADRPVVGERSGYAACAEGEEQPGSDNHHRGRQWRHRSRKRNADGAAVQRPVLRTVGPHTRLEVLATIGGQPH
jgi:hypothetical protein